jgi:hypothetical protein
MNLMNAPQQSQFSSLTVLLGAVIFVAVFAASICSAVVIEGPKPGQANSTNLQNASPVIVVNCSSEKDPWDKINIIAAIFGVTATFASVFFAWKTTRQAQEAARESQRGTERSERFVRAQRLSDLFEDMQKLTFLTEEEKNRIEEASNFEQDKMIPLDEAVGRKISANANIMEKIAFCWKNDLVDRAGIEEQLGEDYIRLYDQIAERPRILWLNRTGKETVKDTPSATILRNHLAEKINKIKNEP